MLSFAVSYLSIPFGIYRKAETTEEDVYNLLLSIPFGIYLEFLSDDYEKLLEFSQSLLGFILASHIRHCELDDSQSLLGFIIGCHLVKYYVIVSQSLLGFIKIV